MDFWIIIDQRHAGPFTIEQLREQGITPERLVWHDGLTDWTPAGEIEALAQLFEAPEPTPPRIPEPEPQAPRWQQPQGAPQQPQNPEFQYSGAPGQQYGYNPQQPPYQGRPQQPYQPQQSPQYAPGQPPVQEPPQCPPTYLVWAIIATICCCLPAGIVAIIYAVNIKNAYYSGDYAKAYRNSSRAQIWIIVSIVLGIIAIPLQILYYLGESMLFMN